jgi:hypothetical protein
VSSKLSTLVPNLSDEIDNSYPHIAKEIVELWGTISCLEYIESLLTHDPIPDRPTRAGFPLSALLNIELIYETHIERYPYLESKKMKEKRMNPWSN